MGDRRIGRVCEVEGGVEFEVLGTPGERCRVSGWCVATLRVDRWEPGGAVRAPEVELAERDVFTLHVEIGERGWCSLRPLGGRE